MTQSPISLRRALVSALALSTLTLLGVLTVAGPAAARRNGYFGNCAQCHKDESGTNVAVTLTPDQFEPGALVRIRVEVSREGANVGGFFISCGGVGELIPLGGDTRTNGTQITHTEPKSMSGGSLAFEVDWQAPSEPRAVHLQVYGVAANGNNNPSGDGTGGPMQVDRIFGCEGSTYYRDFDGDGYGTDLVPPLQDCSAPVGYAPNGGDCSEDDAMLNPGMTETCNMIDDDCDTRVDEFAAPTCGIGLCMRYAEYCDPAAPCFPGDPMPEACNGLDDDCDDVVDQGELCMGDLVCHQAVCKTLDEALAIEPDFVPFQGSEPAPIPSGPAGAGGMPAASGGMSSVPAPTGGVPSTGAPMGGTVAIAGMPPSTAPPATAGASSGASPSPAAAPQASCGVTRPRATEAFQLAGLLLLAGLAAQRRRRR